MGYSHPGTERELILYGDKCVRACVRVVSEPDTGLLLLLVLQMLRKLELTNGIMGCRDLFIHLFIGVGIGREEMSD